MTSKNKISGISTAVVNKKRKKFPKWLKIAIVVASLMMAVPGVVVLADGETTSLIGTSQNNIFDIILSLTLISLVPSILIMMTCFTRIIIVLSFLRNAIGIQQSPPNQVLIGITIFITLFVMRPVLNDIDQTAYKPYKNQEITQQEFLDKAAVPIKEFMLKQTKSDDLDLFVEMSGTDSEQIENAEDLSLTVVIPAFMTSELKRAFLIGFLLYIPFLIIDMIVSSTLMSMGMIMLPPTMISLPFKLLLFVLVDGWGLLFKTLIMTYN